MEYVPRRLLRWTLIFALVIWVAGLAAIGWGVWRAFTESEHHLIEMLVEGRK